MNIHRCASCIGVPWRLPPDGSICFYKTPFQQKYQNAKPNHISASNSISLHKFSSTIVNTQTEDMERLIDLCAKNIDRPDKLFNSSSLAIQHKVVTCNIFEQ